MLSKSFRLGPANLGITFEILNVLDERYQVTLHRTMVPLESIKPWHFSDYLSFNNDYYHPAADLNHDGMIIPFEHYVAFRDLIASTDDWVAAYSAPRRARIGVTFSL